MSNLLKTSWKTSNINETAWPSEDLSSLEVDLDRVSISSLSRWGDCGRKLRMSQDKVRAAQSLAQWRMKSLNQWQGLPVTGHHDLPMRHNVEDYIQPLTDWHFLCEFLAENREGLHCFSLLCSFSFLCSLQSKVFPRFGSLHFFLPHLQQ